MVVEFKILEEYLEKFKLAKTVEQKLDIAYEIYLEASNFISESTAKSKAKTRAIELREKAMSFMRFALNVDSDESVIRLMEKRKKMKEFRPDFLPRGEELVGVGDAETKGQYNWRRLARLGLELERGGIKRVNEYSRNGDVYGNTIFLDYEQRAANRIIIKDGVFYRPLEGAALDQEQFELCDTARMKSHDKKGFAAYVISAQGEISIFNHHNMADRYAHSSMSAGASVFGAGELRIEDGKLKAITTHSGHYQPSMEDVFRILKFFEKQGVDVSDVEIYSLDKVVGITREKSKIPNSPKYVYNASDIKQWGIENEKKAAYLRVASKMVKNIVRLGNFDAIERVLKRVLKKTRLEKSDYNIKQKLDLNKTILMYAVEFGRIDIVRKLLAAGADPKARDDNGKTALMYAVEKGNLDIVKELLAKGVDLEAKDIYGKTALMYAAENGNLDIFEKLLDAGVDFNAVDRNKKTVLMYAVEKGNLEIVKALLAKGVDLEAQDKYGKKALMYAAEKGNLEIVKELLAKGVDLEAGSIIGKTALGLAANAGNLEIVKELLARGANPVEGYIHKKTTPGYAGVKEALKRANIIDSKTAQSRGYIDNYIVKKGPLRKEPQWAKKKIGGMDLYEQKLMAKKLGELLTAYRVDERTEEVAKKVLDLMMANQKRHKKAIFARASSFNLEVLKKLPEKLQTKICDELKIDNIASVTKSGLAKKIRGYIERHDAAEEKEPERDDVPQFRM